MCGFAGIVDYSAPVDASRAFEMARILAHRGPDDEGTYVAPGVALAHRRLAIIDLSADAHQPMTYESGRYVLVYNGEIYNYRELRAELEARGVRFRSNSDTEVVLAAYHVWGDYCVRRFNGMWAFAVWDAVERRLFCSRDRFGIKPFYYAVIGRRIAFASELKAFRADSAPLRPNALVVRDFLSQGYVDHSDQTFFAGIAQLPPAHSLTFGQDGLRVYRYWSLTPRPAPEEPVSSVRELFLDAVRLHLRSDVAVGTCLSGGLDSSAIACGIDQILQADATSMQPVGKHQKTFTSYFEDPGLDERPYACAVVERIGAHPHWISFSDKELLEELPAIVEAQDEPFGSTSIVAQWFVMRAARDAGIKVLLDGQGADELLAGYDGYFGFWFADLLLQTRFRDFAAEVAAYRTTRGASPFAILTALLRPLVPSALEPRVRARAIGASHLVHHELRRLERTASDFGGEGRPFSDRLHRQLHFTLTRRLPELLHYEDRNSMSHSVEARVPFLDYRLAELLFSLDGNNLIERGRTKVVLRRGLSDLLPALVRDRVDKIGFATPEGRWLRGRLGEFAADVFGSRAFRERGFVDVTAAQRRLERHRRGELEAGWELTRALTLELWAREFLDR
jgi:asparagine synthase (glutamine-hydrolysing)